MQISRRIRERDTDIRIDTLKLKTGKTIKVLNGASMEVETKDDLPMMSGKVGGKNVKVFLDGRCNRVTVKRML